MDAIMDYLAGWNLAAIICLIIGLGLLIAEMFTPGFGIFGISGIALLIAAVVLSADTFAHAMVSLIILLVLVCLLGFIILNSLGNGKFSKSAIVLSDKIASASNEVSGKSDLTGKEGIAVSPLRPAGIAEIDGGRYDVTTKGEFVAQGARLTVERTHGLKIIVREGGPERCDTQDCAADDIPDEGGQT